LAEKSGVPQSTIGRIEAGTVDPRVGTLNRLLRACGFDLEVAPLLGQGVDRSQIRQLVKLTPAERIARAVEAANAAQIQDSHDETGLARSEAVPLTEAESLGALRDEIDREEDE